MVTAVRTARPVPVLRRQRNDAGAARCIRSSSRKPLGDTCGEIGRALVRHLPASGLTACASVASPARCAGQPMFHYRGGERCAPAARGAPGARPLHALVSRPSNLERGAATRQRMGNSPSRGWGVGFGAPSADEMSWRPRLVPRRGGVGGAPESSWLVSGMLGVRLTDGA